MSAKQRDAVLIVEAAAGFRREANALIRRAVKAAGLKVSAFIGRAEGASYGLAETRFIVPCTDDECATLRRIGSELAKAEGWERFPVDLYHD